MIAILNGDTDHEIPVTEASMDYLEQGCHLKNTDLNAWSADLTSWMLSQKNQTITSISIQHDPTMKQDYTNLNGWIDSVKAIMQEDNQQNAYDSLELIIRLGSSI